MLSLSIHSHIAPQLPLTEIPFDVMPVQ